MPNLLRDTFHGNAELTRINAFAVEQRRVPHPEEIQGLIDFRQRFPLSRLLVAFHRLYVAWIALNKEEHRAKDRRVEAIMAALRTARADKIKAGDAFKFSDIEPILRDVLE